MAIFTSKIWDEKTCESCSFLENYYTPLCKYNKTKRITSNIKTQCPSWCPRKVKPKV